MRYLIPDNNNWQEPFANQTYFLCSVQTQTVLNKYLHDKKNTARNNWTYTEVIFKFEYECMHGSEKEDLNKGALQMYSKYNLGSRNNSEQIDLESTTTQSKV